jgi:O-acetyl-ADP-ribose deacetylase (regulator of RNase III)
MPIEYASGDLFANVHNARALAHGCNCQGSMGAGIATGFRDRYPAMFAEYRRRFKAQPREFNLGDAFLWKDDNKPWVFNLGTQEGVWQARASYDAIEAALASMRHQADREGIASIAVPRVGAGYGGLSWTKVRAVVEKVFADWPGTLYVYEEYVPEENAKPKDGVAGGQTLAEGESCLPPTNLRANGPEVATPRRLQPTADFPQLAVAEHAGTD